MCANNDPGRIDGAIIPRVNVLVNGQPARALIDSGCTQTLVGPTIQTGKAYGLKRIMTADGRMINCEGETPVVLTLAGKTIEVLCVVTKKMVLGVDIIVGTDVLKHFKFSMNYGRFSIAAAVDSPEMIQESLTTTKNKADALTRVPRRWLRKCTSDPADTVAVSQSCLENHDLVEHSHRLHHCGVDTTLYFARQLDPNVGRNEVDHVVKNCRECQSIDPSSTRIDGGELSVPDDWRRVAVDVTHYGLQKYLTMVDCGPSRFAIWRIIRSEAETEVVSVLRQVFSQFGPPAEMLCDNGRSFTSKLMRDFCEFWAVRLAFRCAYKPSGNGIVERNHRTIKRMSARSGRSVEYCVYWYNVTPHCDQRIIPSRKLISYKWRNPFLERSNGMRTVDDHELTGSEFDVGDEVWVKPPGARCTTPWKPGVVTGVNSKYNVEIDKVPRHVRDIRRRLANEFHEREQGVVSEPLPSNNSDFLTESFEASENGAGTDENASTSRVRRVARKRQLPVRFNDFLL